MWCLAQVIFAHKFKFVGVVLRAVHLDGASTHLVGQEDALRVLVLPNERCKRMLAFDLVGGGLLLREERQVRVLRELARLSALGRRRAHSLLREGTRLVRRHRVVVYISI